MTGTALITGASSGIGWALAHHHASRGGACILTARRQDKLVELKAVIEAEHGVRVDLFPADLGQPGAAERLYQSITAAGHQVDILINNAGFGGVGHHVERDLDAELAIIDVNLRALVALTHGFAADMVARGHGRILNVGSTAGFMPGPNQAVYFATKAFVNSFSQAIDHELRPRGVTCTVLAPGYVETEFAQVAGMDGTRLARTGGATAQSAARCGYEAMMKGRLIAINDRRLGFLLNWILPLMPRRLVLKAVARSMSK